ncbi:Vi polysaccharide biosynthesis protein VipA/TviB [Thiohalorhabdus denitrificans]|uniref:UDP-N-acetyl-D-galactosamine dehydrogenase n=1 Tax=Thiohalorhabdus denitrificans TaxID=381306 RepID=A0A0P9ELW2_9GAMM|nr:Vi polysaccharide biosynthesis UDP-N-acetylglucosamine C-6 dehydrogenase TviB [Thiohalorhabdus denitrificans]KPV39578.1 Vi polysaccharide biosynthesis protein VipA/TviB [Thiohalorhabdus denitrificans]SCX97979.1 UDP-N-acetyl-D-galactosamine dehydrogenase [Thiohalorhabdus denitrificans]
MAHSEDLFEKPQQPVIGVIGLGYVGLPLAAALGRLYRTVGFDVSPERIEELQAGHDRTREVPSEDLAAAESLTFSADEAALDACNVHIVTVPTPVDAHKNPDLGPLRKASETVGRHLQAGDVVVFESTVYPGATEEVCVPVLEEASGLAFNRDFFVGYSPERINPGDKNHRLTSIPKVTAGSTPKTAEFVDELYGRVVTAGTHQASSIQVAEAAKVIENTQRDVNIALVNELALLFNRLGIDTEEVLAAAGTKWNFLPFRPGLVGGHCIGVDPYYLTHKAQEIGHHPEMILAGRRINDGMGPYIADATIKCMIKRGFPVVGSRILVMGLTFKENCPDLRNTRVVDIVDNLADYHAKVDVWDPWVDTREAEEEYGLTPLAEPPGRGQYDALILAVPHQEFLEMGPEGVRELGMPEAVLFDVKSAFPREASDLRL